MPVTKRYILDSHMYGSPDLYEESSRESLLQDMSMSGALGAIHQIRFLAMYTVEVCHYKSRYSVFYMLFFRYLTILLD